jgi:sterol desaturase/sphingolipid hydroxylase (fatty acid hydroxylase superfamily)
MHLDELFVKSFATPFLLVVILLELALSAFLRLRIYEWKDTFLNLVLTGLNLLVESFAKGFNYALLLLCFHYQFMHIDNPYVYWFVLFLAEDLAYYTLHVVDHYVRFFWAIHVTHHSSSKFNFTVGFRSSVFQPFYRVVYFLPLAFFGFDPLHILFMYAVTQFYGTLVHSDYVGKLGILEYFLVTPSHHRVHHASNPVYLDKNMGMCLIIWDRIFGTFQEELDDVRPQYGLTTNLKTFNPVTVIFHEWVAIFNDIWRPVGFRNRLRYIFGLPGWSHDNSRMTSVQMREHLHKGEQEALNTEAQPDIA